MGAFRQRGYTFVELLVVVTLVGLGATIAMTSSASGDAATLEIAATEVADALRFAREESRRTGVIHGISADLANHEFSVFRLDEAPNPNLVVFDVYRPVSKQPYVIPAPGSRYGQVTIKKVDAKAEGTCGDLTRFGFDASGVLRCTEPATTRISGVMIRLELRDFDRRIFVDDYTGRVSIQ